MGDAIFDLIVTLGMGVTKMKKSTLAITAIGLLAMMIVAYFAGPNAITEQTYKPYVFDAPVAFSLPNGFYAKLDVTDYKSLMGYYNVSTASRGQLSKEV